MKIVCKNRKAFYDYSIEETMEAGIILLGTEVKSLRNNLANLKDSYAIIRDSEATLLNCHISPYSHGNIINHEPLRTRKLLLHKQQIEKLKGKITQKGYSLIPLKIYFKNGLVKVELGLARGKRQYEKRESIKEKEAQREIEKALKGKNK